jgi:Family of unknown function (DUF6335)
MAKRAKREPTRRSGRPTARPKTAAARRARAGKLARRPPASVGRATKGAVATKVAKARKVVKVRKIDKGTTGRPGPARQRPKQTAARPSGRTQPRTPAASTPSVERIAGKKARARRIPTDTTPTPPSSLDMDRHGSAVRSGRAEMAQAREQLGAMGALTRGDTDADALNAYFSGDEAPGGDNPTPDQDIVDDIGRAIGIEYQDNEELRGSDKVTERDKHRWELDPASSDDFKERK